MPTRAARDGLIKRLASIGILAVSHFRPLHLSKMGAMFGARPGQCPVAEVTGDCLIRLPLFTSMSTTDQELVIDEVLQFEC
jgi:dTDP-4-amino-4,6-dideoxygalactose transaminase